MVIRIPAFKIVFIENYDLTLLDTQFESATFERPIRAKMVENICNSMKNNDFYNPFLCVTEKVNGVHAILDGQHRHAALRKLRDEYNVTHYPLVLIIYSPEHGREIFRNGNLGAAVSPRDYLKSYDNDKKISYPFFENLPFTHEKTSENLSYLEAIKALYYAKTKQGKIPKSEIGVFLDTITQQDILLLKRVNTEINQFTPSSGKEILMSNGVLMPLLAVIYKNKMSVGEIKLFFSEVYHSAPALENMKSYKYTKLHDTFEIMQSIFENMK